MPLPKTLIYAAIVIVAVVVGLYAIPTMSKTRKAPPWYTEELYLRHARSIIDSRRLDGKRPPEAIEGLIEAISSYSAEEAKYQRDFLEKHGSQGLFYRRIGDGFVMYVAFPYERDGRWQYLCATSEKFEHWVEAKDETALRALLGVQ